MFNEDFGYLVKADTKHWMINGLKMDMWSPSREMLVRSPGKVKMRSSSAHPKEHTAELRIAESIRGSEVGHRNNTDTPA